jgi:hypothetical protein
MEAFNLQPTAAGSDSLSCGAIAIDPKNPDRVFVGTGEGDNVFISDGIIQGSGAYFGVGPLFSSDGGKGWHTEDVAEGSPSLAGASFYRLAVDPDQSDRVVAATILGTYLREPAASGGFRWRQVKDGICTSVVVSRATGKTRFYAANYGGTPWESSDGANWKEVASGFPDADVGRIGLAAGAADSSPVYALIARESDTHLLGIYRYDPDRSVWTSLSGAPTDLFGSDPKEAGQGSYDLAIAVDPGNPNRIYIGGSTRLSSNNEWAASLFRADVDPGSASMKATAIGEDVHADVHTIEFTPGNSNQLWVGCDGGVFKSLNPADAAAFSACNIGLSTLTMNRLGVHPSQDAILFCGTQDNGTVRYNGDDAWLHVAAGDGGSVVVHPGNPYRVLRSYVENSLQAAADGGRSYDSWTDINVPLRKEEHAEFYAPLAGSPPGSATPDLVAFGSVCPWVSPDFGTTWYSIPNNDYPADQLDSPIVSLMFTAANRFYAGTFKGGVYRCDFAEDQWRVTRIDAPPLLSGPVTGITNDPADAAGNSIFVALGGSGDFRHVWHYDGAKWEPRSGPGAANSKQSLMDVHHNVIVADPKSPQTLYAGADIGVWRSTDAGKTWRPFAEGLPEAAVIDLKLAPNQPLLWAATHGRGVYERTTNTETARGVEIYLRDTDLDRGRYPTVDGLPNPFDAAQKLSFRRGPGIKVDPPTASGAYLTPSNQIDFYEYCEVLRDSFARIRTKNAVNRIYVLVHNRGVVAAKVEVTLLVATLHAGAPPDLPAGYDAAVRSGSPILEGVWHKLGVCAVDGVQPGLPRVAAFDLPGSSLPDDWVRKPKGTHVLLALIHAAADPYDNTTVAVDALCLSERKACQRVF